MTSQELAKKTVLQLRQIAKENKIKLGAGVSKEDIIRKISEGMENDNSQKTPLEAAAESPKINEKQQTVKTNAAAETEMEKLQQAQQPQKVTSPVQTSSEGAMQQSTVQPQFKAAWKNPSPRQIAPRPVYGQQPAAPRNNSWQSAPQRPSGYQEVSRPVQQRPNIAPHRFGPDASEQRQEEQRRRNTFPQDRSISQFSRESKNDYPDESTMPTVSELIASGDCIDTMGYLDILNDGTGFLRTGLTLQAGPHDVYVSASQVARFDLHCGDLILGKVSSQRVSGKLLPLLFITEVNGQNSNERNSHEDFERMTPNYPTQMFNLDTSRKLTIDESFLLKQMNPIGKGQRSIILTPASMDSSPFLQLAASAIAENTPNLEVLYVAINGRPEDTAVIQNKIGCTVFSSSFEKDEEVQIHMAELALSHAKRLAEMHKDVLLVVDNLTNLSSFGENGAAEAKKIFNAARKLNEGGSLTVITSMDREPQSLVKQFVRASNHCLQIQNPVQDTQAAFVRTISL